MGIPCEKLLVVWEQHMKNGMTFFMVYDKMSGKC